MKKLAALTLIALGGAGALVSWLGLGRQGGGPPNRIAVWFTPAYTLTDLQLIQSQLLPLGVKLVYNALSFTNTGHLLSISFSVYAEDIPANAAASWQATIAEESSVGFILDRQPEGETAFYIGPKPP